jgi:hypothetical protein
MRERIQHMTLSTDAPNRATDYLGPALCDLPYDHDQADRQSALDARLHQGLC